MRNSYEKIDETEIVEMENSCSNVKSKNKESLKANNSGKFTRYFKAKIICVAQ